MIWLLIFVLSYLIGSIPSGYLVARSKGIDIRQRGSSNIGAANVARVMGKKWGYLVGFCDFLKGFLAVKLGFLIAAHFLSSSVLGGVTAAIAGILGHNYTIWLGFKGGKGIATSGGAVYCRLWCSFRVGWSGSQFFLSADTPRWPRSLRLWSYRLQCS
jgi:glycerol-3-phosphate acyltransferase PlsY